MARLLIICWAILLLFVGVVSAAENISIDSYTQTVELEPGNSFHTIDAIFNGNDLIFYLPPRAEELKVKIDDKQITCTLNEKKGFSVLNCQLKEGGKHFIQLNFETTYPLLEIKDRIFYKSEASSPYSISDFIYILKLPVGVIIPSEKDMSFFVSPKPKRVYSDGQRIILLWEKKDVREPFEVSVMMEPLAGAQVSGYWMLAIALLGFLALVGYVIRKRKKTITYPALIEHEKVIVELLKKEHGVLWQKQIQIQSKFSKVKVSRVLRSLEQRGVIKKEPWGNTNKIHLVEEQQAENGSQEDTS